MKSFAALYEYNVAGEVQIGGTYTCVQGDMTISDEFLYSQSTFDLGVYGFDITRFSLRLNETLKFSGDAGVIRFVKQIFDPSTGMSFYEDQWGIWNEENNWSSSHGRIIFMNNEMERYLPTATEYFGKLAPIISLPGGITSLFSNPNHSHVSGTLLLTREKGPVPVPEPATMLLFGTGLVGLIGLRIKRKK